MKKNKAISTRMFLYATVSVICVMLITYLILFSTAKANSDLSEEIEFQQNFRRITVIIDTLSSSLESTALDWAHWDDTYNFIVNKNKSYIFSNLQDTTLKTLNLDYMIFLDTDSNIVYEITNNLSDNLPLFTDRLSLLKLSNKDYLPDFENVNVTKTGFLLSSGSIFLVSVSPITTSDEKAERNGTLIIGRILRESFIDNLNVATQERVELLSSDAANLFSLNQSEKIQISSLDENLNIIQQAKTSTGYKVFQDIFGEYTIPVTITIERQNYLRGKKDLHQTIIVFAIVITLAVSVDFYLFNNYFAKRVSSLYEFYKDVAEKKDTKMRANISGHDEISELANATNYMLNKLDIAYEEIKLEDERFRLIMEATNDGYLDFDVQNSHLYISPQWLNYLGIQNFDNENLLQEFKRCIHPDSYSKVMAYYYYFINSTEEYFEQEYKVNNIYGETVWILHRGKVTKRDRKGKPARVICTLSDITSRKKYDEEILIFSYSDKLTGLNNRAYVEKMLEDLERQKIANFSIIMGDLNGLKLANDAFGHKEGDRMLICVADILKIACAADDVISRWGGDEFVILVKNKNSTYISDLITRIKEYCDRFTGLPLKISIALGSADNPPDNFNVEATMQLAEERMYRNKLMESKSARSAIILTLEKSLSEKHNETEDHTHRIQTLSLQMGTELHLSSEKMDELSLLAALHDIGKIGIPDYILTKPGKLNADEWEIMKTHTDIGYRIAMATPELAYIADAILYHHERFDGSGYPQGFKGKEIPLISRILNIVDSFDVMTHSRSYKEAYSLEESIKEIKKCAGTQFDPELVAIFLKLVEENKIII